MRRFRDVHDVDDPVVAELAGMLQAVGDLDPPLGAEARVRAALSRRGAPRPSWLRTVVVLLLVVAIPVAVAGVNLLIRMPPQAAGPAADRGTPAAAHDRADPMTKVSPVAPVSPARAQDAPSPGVARAVPAPSTPEVDRSPARRAASDETTTRRTPAVRQTETHPNEYSKSVTRSTATPVESPVELPRLATRAPDENRADPMSIRSDEANLVHGAMRALRRDHDPQAAIRQLAAYHRRFPTGDLTEEALALSIEAFVALDDREALALANEYLRRFPDGRFRDQAERAQHRFLGSHDAPPPPGSIHPSRAPQVRPAP